MKHTDIINELVRQTGETRENCEAIVKGFEKVSEQALIHKMKGRPDTQEEIIGMVSENTGIERTACDKVITVLKETMDNGLANKLRFVKRSR